MPLSLPDDTLLAPGAPLHSIPLPASKSITNRALLLAALAPGRSRLVGGLEAEDTRWMREALKRCGIPIQEAGEAWELEGGRPPAPEDPLFLGASGTTLRFLLPWLALKGQTTVTLTGDPRLFERPLGPLEAVLTGLGARLTRTPEGLRVAPVQDAPRALDLEVDASLSSQFLTGLALTAASLEGCSRLRWTQAASPSYLALTTQWLTRFGCQTTQEDRQWTLPGGSLHPVDLHLPADWSAAAAFYAAAAVTGRAIRLGPWDPEDLQGDRRILSILEEAGCRVTREGRNDGEWISVEGPLRRGLAADLTLCPDLGPVLAATAALAPGPSTLTGLDTLRLKECDRLEASAELATWLGAQAETVGDAALHIQPGPDRGPRPPFSPRNDHRMAFAAAVGALRRPGNLLDPGCVAKTFPEFWSRWQQMLAP
jgi:3-phosphoshikimate 1-carboxyvinyltransferase